MQILGITDNLPGTPAVHTVPDPNREVSVTGSRVLAMADDTNCLVLMDRAACNASRTYWKTSVFFPASGVT